ncbi:MAG: DDE-type integrase/transposase/recombinase, partial [Proteobacteria bacterium]|nr:DDE-type integrase/transposase/recombinase [Pseudomonadota bacterium]
WHVDETYVKVAGVWKYVYRAVDESMEVIDVHVSDNRDKTTAKRFFKKCIEVTGDASESIRSDSHRGYDQVKEIFPNTRHHKVKCLNNKAESSHVPIPRTYKAKIPADERFQEFRCNEDFFNILRIDVSVFSENSSKQS